MPETSLHAVQAQRQEQQLSVRQMQSLELLQKPLPALLEELRAELESNPVLEADVSRLEVPSGDPLSAPDPGDAADSGDDNEPAAPADDWRDELPLPPDTSAPDGAHEAFLNTSAGEKSLEQLLLDELAVSGASGERRRLAEWIIGSIDDSGYLRTPPADLAMAANASLDDVLDALKLVQSFDPPGVGAFTPQECLLLQIDRLPDASPRLRELVRDHLSDIARNKLPQVAAAMKISFEELDSLIAEVKKLSPYPGAALSPAHAPYVAPEAEIVRGDDGNYHVVPGERYIRLRIPKRYFDMLEDPALSDADRKYIRDKIDAARELIRALDMRDTTVRRIADVIAREQKDFFDRGVEALKPLTMRRAAEILELHETTVSRAVSGKFVRTPRGVFELKYFFSSGYAAVDGETFSSRSVHERIRRIIDAEDPAHPLSDEAVSQALAAEGLSVARRTVAKYRDLLGIPGTSLRRRFSAPGEKKSGQKKN